MSIRKLGKCYVCPIPCPSSNAFTPKCTVPDTQSVLKFYGIKSYQKCFEIIGLLFSVCFLWKSMGSCPSTSSVRKLTEICHSQNDLRDRMGEISLKKKRTYFSCFSLHAKFCPEEDRGKSGGQGRSN